jgi:DNA-binding winged helix-turn-helix (wHTH) protein/TolB-like protein/tetratricopeptide (TPR) repeat protein
VPVTEQSGDPAREPTYVFGPFRFDPADQRLLMAGTPVPASPKVLDTLKALIEHRGRLVGKDVLLQRLWPDAFVQEATLARHISELRRVLGEPARGGRFLETVPTRGYRFIADVQVIPAEQREDNHSGEPLQAPVVGPPSMPRPRGAYLIPAALLFAAAVVAVAWSWRGTSPPIGVASLAVLPFETLGRSEDDRILAMGLADSLIGRLGGVSAVTIRPIGAVRQYVDSTVDPVEVGRRLRVESVLTGSIQRDGATLNVSAHLVRIDDGLIVWSGTFTDRSGTLFEVQRAMAMQVALALSPVLSHASGSRVTRRETSVPEAGLAYARGRFFLSRRTNDDLSRAIEYFGQAVRADPSFALAYVGLADGYLLSGGPREPEHEMIAQARAAANKAIEIDPQLGEAHAALGLIAMNYDWDWAAAERQFQTAIRLSPQYATAHAWYGEYLAYRGRFDEGLAAITRARQLDPLSLIINTDAGLILYYARRHDEAIAQLRDILELDRAYLLARLYLALAYSATGRHDEAIAATRFPGRDDQAAGAAVIASVYAKAGRLAEARAAVDRLTALSASGYVSPFFFGVAHASLGDADAAFAAFDRMCRDRGIGAITVKVNPLSDPVRRDPRFPELLRRLGLEGG